MDWLAKQFDGHRAHLSAVAFRMLGSRAEADDAVQEVWLRLGRVNAAEVENLGGWLTTVVARVCLDMLRSRKSRREDPLDDAPHIGGAEPGDAERELSLAQAIGPAMLVVLETMAPAERVAFVLHDMFELSFDEIAAIVGRSPEATRKLASRARQRVRGATVPETNDARHRELVDAFLAASREGRFEALMAVLAPDVVLRADEIAVRAAAANRWGGAPTLASEIRGASAVADTFKGRAAGATDAIIDGHAGAVWAMNGRTRAAFVFTTADGHITSIELIMDPHHLSELEVVLR